jgi:bifunctional NMN adenylyltransferase/nudix hydrolase
MTTKPQDGHAYHQSVLIARSQIVTDPHRLHALAALSISDRLAIVPGSADHSRDLHNPFTAQERIEMWKACLPAGAIERIDFLPQRDVGNRLRWASQVEQKVSDLLRARGLDPDEADVAIVGHRKDASSYYLDDFKNWTLEETDAYPGVSATAARHAYFRLPEDASPSDVLAIMGEAKVPLEVASWLVRHHGSPEWRRLAEEASRADRTAAPYALRTSPDGPGLPHPVQFNAADALIVHGNRILMHRRRQHPGKGLWALPGGMIGIHERAVQAAVRHAIEKTGLDMPASQLASCLVDSWYMDDPWRSTRERTISFPSLFEIAPLPRGRTPTERRRSTALVRVRASDDVAWMTTAEIEEIRSEIFEDHAIIIDQGLERLALHRPR